MKHILIVAPAWVGDMVMAQSLLILLKARHPKATIDVIAPEWTLDLLARMPQVRRAIPLPLGHGKLALRTRWRLGKSLRGEHYDWAIVLPNSWKSALPVWAAKIRRRTGYIGEFRYGLLNDTHILNKKKRWRMVDRFNALSLINKREPLPPAPEPQLQASADGARAAMARLGIAAPSGPILALCPGAEYGPAKRWPLAHFAEVAQRKLAQGWAVWLFGSAKDAEITGKINALAQNRCVDLAGKTQLGEAIDLMALSAAVVSNDSGLMHVAAALGRPLAAVFGSSDPTHTPPLSSAAKVLYLGLDCSPCFERDCPLGHTHCLVELKPNQVLDALPN